METALEEIIQVTGVSAGFATCPNTSTCPPPLESDCKTITENSITCPPIPDCPSCPEKICPKCLPCPQCSTCLDVSSIMARKDNHIQTLKWDLDVCQANLSSLNSLKSTHSDLEISHATMKKDQSLLKSDHQNLQRRHHSCINHSARLESQLDHAKQKFKNSSLLASRKYSEISRKLAQCNEDGRKLSSSMTEANTSLTQCLGERSDLSSRLTESEQASSNCQADLVDLSSQYNESQKNLTWHARLLTSCRQDFMELNGTARDAVNKYLAAYSLTQNLARNYSTAASSLLLCENRIQFLEDQKLGNITVEDSYQNRINMLELDLLDASEKLTLCQIMESFSKTLLNMNMNQSGQVCICF